MKTKRKSKLYLVGFDGDKQCVYGFNHNAKCSDGIADPFSFKDAKKFVDSANKINATGMSIYKLVKVK